MKDQRILLRFSDFLAAIAITAAGAGILLCTPTLTLNPLTWIFAAFCLVVGLLFLSWGLAIIKDLVDKDAR